MKYKILISLILMFLLTGCWNYRELNEIAVCTGIAIDKDDKNYVVSVLIANSKKPEVSSKEGEAQSSIYVGSGETITSALEIIDTKIPKELYLAHLDTVVISKDVAKEGVYKTIDFLLRNPNSRRQFYVVVSKEKKANDILKILSPLESFPSENIATNIQSSLQVESSIIEIKYNEYLKTLLEDGIEPVLTSVSVIGNTTAGEKIENIEESEADTYIKLDNAAIFRDDKFISFASTNETIAINMLTNRSKYTSLNFKCGSSYFVIQISYIKTKPKVKVVDDKIEYTFDVVTNASVGEDNCNMDLTNPKVIDNLTNQTVRQLHTILSESINAFKYEYKSDVLGLGQILYRNNPKYFNQVKDKWDSIYPNVKVNLNIKVKLKTKGAAENTVRGYLSEKQ